MTVCCLFRPERLAEWGRPALAGVLLVLVMASPLWAAPPPSGAPCNATGSLGTSMGGCATPPAPPAPKTPSAVSLSNADFAAPETFRIRTGKTGQEETIRKNIAAWVAKRAVPRPTPSESALLNSTILGLSRTSFPFIRGESGPEIVSVTVEARTLNAIAARLRRAVSSGRLAYRVHRTAVTGGTPGENRFVERSLPISPSGVVDAQAVSESLYRVSQVPGFSRADGVFSPVAGPGSVSPPAPLAPQTGSLFAPEAPAPPLENLLVHVTPAPTFSGSQIELDNYGYAPTGALILNATGNVNNAGIAGGLFAVSASTSFGGMNAGTISYSLPFGLMNRAGVDFNALNYTLGNGFSPWGHGANAAQLTALGVSGSNYSGDAWGMQTFIEAPDRKLALKETLFLKEYQDTYSQTSQNDRSILGGTLDLSGFRTLGKIMASFDLTDTEYDLTQGSGSNPANPFYNSTQGLQNYLTGNAQISYALTPVWSATLGTVDQQYIGGGVLDPMLQATLGGVSNVMALPTASLFGNDLYVGTLTLARTDATRIASFASSLFFDAGQVTGIGTNYSAMGPGVEESVSAPHWFARGDLAVPVGGLPTQILGQNITALTGGNIGQGGIPLQLWLSAGLRY